MLNIPIPNYSNTHGYINANVYPLTKIHTMKIIKDNF